VRTLRLAALASIKNKKIVSLDINKGIKRIHNEEEWKQNKRTKDTNTNFKRCWVK